MMARRIVIATLALLLTAAPLAVNAQTYVNVRIGGPGYYVRYANAPRRYYRPYWHPHRYWRRPVAYAPVYPVSYAASYGPAPGGWYGWRWHNHWWRHRRWRERHWMYY